MAVDLSRGINIREWPFASLKNLRCWIASGFMARGFCSVIALAMTSLEERHCEGNDKCIDGDIKPEAI